VELPRIEPLYQKYRDQGFEIIAMDSHRDTEGARKFIGKHDLSYPCLENGESDNDIAYDIYQVQGHPTSLLIDGDGRILYLHFGWQEGDEKKLEREIQRVLSL